MPRIFNWHDPIIRKVLVVYNQCIATLYRLHAKFQMLLKHLIPIHSNINKGKLLIIIIIISRKCKPPTDELKNNKVWKELTRLLSSYYLVLLHQLHCLTTVACIHAYPRTRTHIHTHAHTYMVISPTIVTVVKQWAQRRDALLHEYGFNCRKIMVWLPDLTLHSPRLTCVDLSSTSDVQTFSILNWLQLRD